MKTIKFLACAALLTSAVALSSCKSEGQNEPNKPAQVVKTEFAIAFPQQASNGAKRMPSTTVPANGTFLGMKNIALIPFAKAGAIESTDVRLGDANIAGITDIPASGEGTITTTGNAKRYENISIPLTTASFLVYAEASNAATSGANDATKHTNGYLKATGIAAGVPSDIHFDLAPVMGEAALNSIYTDEKAVALLALLNAVVKAQDSDSEAWKSYEAGDDAGMVAMLNTFKTMHALSSFEVHRVLSDLYRSVEPLKAAAAPVGTLATNIQTAIEAGLEVTRDGEGNLTGIAATLKTTPTDYTGYPANLNLPDGAVRIKYVAGENPFTACAAGDYENQTVPTSFAYPASLWYYANSQIKTANSSMATYYANGTAWADIITAYENAGKPAVVNSETRSVAIANQIQYAVGRLDVQVKLNATTLSDKADNTITANAAGFPVTAVFIGNQRQLLFDFKPTEAASPTLYTIYDNALTDIVADDGDYNTLNSTLVLETPATAGSVADPNADVQIAIELTNNSVTGDFMGHDGALIPAGGKFYLVATLSAKDAAQTGKKVFAQDFVTTAKLNITSLANAYNEIPDLRTPQLELGMSVDLSWQSGHVYEIPIP